MKVLVLGGTGTVGSTVAAELLARKVEVHVLTRSAEKAAALPPGAHSVIGDLLDVATIRSAFQGMDGVFLLNVVSPNESHEGLMSVCGARLARVKRVVYLSVQAADEAAYLPHFGSKVGVEAGLKASPFEWTILRPNNFYQNDVFFRDALLQYGVYPIALTEGGHAGQTYNLVGPDAWTGAKTAEVWSRALGRPVAYAGNDLDAWEKQSLQYLPDYLVFDFKQMYQFFQETGFKGTPGDVERQTKLLGHPPRRFEDYVRETALAWKASA